MRPTGQDVDWDAVVRRSRRRGWYAGAWLVLAAWSLVRLHADLFADPGTRWLFVGVTALVTALVGGTVALSRRRTGRVDRRTAAIAQYAVQHHVDPGEPAREAADRQARMAAALRWYAPFYVLLLVQPLLRLGDEVAVEPSSVLAALVFASGFVCISAWTFLHGTAAVRWTADPPGPPRPAPPATAWELRTTGRRARTWRATALVCLVVGSVLVVASRALGS
ncbi:hypothetical protein [Goekera deserti]|uniref:Uncharacterized protein n=1 Tax=Goekera deserti TaxID=2497753 RepID=A0A7K3WBB5_9ACTN|nr:hypothetical protein [Goekera deserti]NDI47468.1 hypothetical protein [Goekera deserti]NEL53279.1 hypothetical protein [Goekera deserti]